MLGPANRNHRRRPNCPGTSANRPIQRRPVRPERGGNATACSQPRIGASVVKDRALAHRTTGGVRREPFQAPWPRACHGTRPIQLGRNCPCRRPFRWGLNGFETERNTAIGGGGGNRTGHFVGPRRRSQLQRLACPKPRNDARRSCLAVCSVCQDAFVSASNLRSNAWRAALWSAVYLPFLGVRRP